MSKRVRGAAQREDKKNSRFVPTHDNCGKGLKSATKIFWESKQPK
jgi:hypothetical protein